MSDKELTKTIASESGHWYTHIGVPAYTVIGKNGKERPTTLRDARKLNLYPSVTTIIKVLAAPGLEAWKNKQLLEAALTLPKLPNESLDDYAKRVVADSQEHALKARKKGTETHGALEKYYLTGKKGKHAKIIDAVVAKINEHFPGEKWRAEKSFASPLGYGGKMDLSSAVVVIDFKTKEFDESNLPSCYDEHFMQLSAYGDAIDCERQANVFVSTSNPGLVHVVEHTVEERKRGFEMFLCCLNLWRAQKKYYPGISIK